MNCNDDNASNCKTLVTTSKKFGSPSGELTTTFLFFVMYHHSGSSLFAGKYARSICSIFSLCMESNAFECCLKIFYTYSFNDWTNSQSLRSWELISPNAVLIFPKKFHKFRSDSNEKQDIIKSSSKSDSSVVLSDSEVALFREGEDGAFRSFLFRVSFIHKSNIFVFYKKEKNDDILLLLYNAIYIYIYIL